MAPPLTQTTGRRKEAIARARLRPGTGTITVNGRPFEAYFTTPAHRMEASEPLRVAEAAERFDVDATITGGGVSGPPHVRVFDGQTGALVNEFFAYPGTNTGGVRVGVADVNRDGRLDILAGDGPGFSSSLRVFDGSSMQLMTVIDPFADNYTNGIFVGKWRNVR